MHIVVSGWFWGQPNTGSGQYINWLLPYLESVSRSQSSISSHSGDQPEADDPKRTVPRFTLLLPQQPLMERSGDSVHSSPSANSPAARTVALSSVTVPPPRLPRQLAKLYWEQVIVPRWARRLGADLLLVPYWAAPLWQPTPTVVTVHDLIPLLLPAYRGGRLGRLYTGLVSYTARRCAAVLTVSEAGKRDIIAHLKLPAERVFAVHHGPNDSASRSANRALRHDRPQTGIPPQQPSATRDDTQYAIRNKYALPERYFLYLGGFDVRKNVLGIVRAYRRYLDQGGDPAVQLVLAGTLPRVDTDFFPDPQPLVRQLELTEQVRFIGWVDEDDKAQLYAGATASLFPSEYEGFGMMLLEAMAAGTPVITSSE